MKALISELHAENPNVRGNLFSALSNVRPTHLLDRKLHSLIGLDLMVGTDEGLMAIEGGGSSCGS